MFRKTASVRPLGAFTVDTDGRLSKVAAAGSDDAQRSYYIDGHAKLDVRGILERIADKYAISADPRDYLFEAIRANTTNVPNDNHDGFHRDELLRFDTRLGSAVYLTYREKPHHVNHRTDNPKTARGVIIDAHYNDSPPALDVCPTKGCNTRTAERNNRDASGIHCKKCGSTVKDEFVEILVAIDSKKDPVFADGVRTGALKAGSMGCNCASTVCNVCSNVARSRGEFCEHINSSGKGSLWTRVANKNNAWRRITPVEAQAEFTKRKLAFNTRDLCKLTADDGFEVRKAFEYCQGVEFDEYSRVDTPADPKALQTEVLNKSASNADVNSEDLRTESEQLIARARRKQRQAARRKVAMKFFVVRVDGDDADSYAAESLDQALQLAMPDSGSTVEYAEVEAEDAGAARLMTSADSAWKPVGDDQLSAQGDVVINITDTPEGEQIDMGEPSEEPLQTMEDFTEDEILSPEEPEAPPADMGDEEMSPEELGVLPPGASKEATDDDEHERSASAMSTFAETYRGWQVKVSPHGNAMLVSPKGPVMLFQANTTPKNDEDRLSFGREILTSLWDNGLVKTAQRYDALFHAKFAQVVDHALDDMKEFGDKQLHDSSIEDGMNDMQGIAHDGERPDDSRDDNAEDMSDGKSPEVSSAQQNHMPDHEMGSSKAQDSALADRGSDMRKDPRKDKSLSGDSSLDDRQVDHKMAALLGRDVSPVETPADVWRVSAFDKKANKFTLTNKELESREVSASDIAAAWMQLDRGPSMDEYEAKLKKVYAAKLEEAKLAADERVTAARKQALADVFRAMRIAARRQALNLEMSPLKEAFGVVLANDRTVGYDALTGAPLEYSALPPELSVHLVEAAWKEGGDAEISKLIERTAELMNHDSTYLKSAESDIAKLAHKVPPVTSASMVNDDDRRADELRRQVTAGNLELSSSTEAPAQSHGGRRQSIKAALNSGGIVSSLSSQYRR